MLDEEGRIISGSPTYVVVGSAGSVGRVQWRTATPTADELCRK